MTDIRWVRCPFCTPQQVSDIVAECVMNPNCRDLRVTPESILDRPYRSWDEQNQEYVSEDFTLRTYWFGDRYQSIADGIQRKRQK